MLPSSKRWAMEETLEKVAERLAKLEVTVAEGFHDTRQRFADMEQRDLALSHKIDVQVDAMRADLNAAVHKFESQTEAMRADLQSTAANLNAFTEESRRTAESIRKEHAADRAILTITLQQHAKRIYDLENK